MNILAVTCMRNEAPYCLEWIAHHRAAGVTDFLIYTHDCSDGTDILLDLLPYVTHVPFQPAKDKSPQWRAMQLADQHPLMKATDWAIFFDCDEFFCLQSPLTSISDLIASMPQGTDAIALGWRLFGSSGHIEWTEGLTLERFKRAAPADLALPAGHFFKSLFRPSRFQKLGVHRPKNKSNTQPNWILGGVQAASTTFANDDKRINTFGLLRTSPSAWLNHYSTRSATEFLIKRERGLPNRKIKNIDLSYWAERNFNAVEDLTIQHMLPVSLDELHKLQNLSDVQKHVEHATDIHREIFAELMSNQEEIMLFLYLSLLPGSVPPCRKDIRIHLSRLMSVKASR